MLNEYAASKAIQAASGLMGAAAVMVFLSPKSVGDLISRLMLGLYLATLGVPRSIDYLGMLGTTDDVLLIGGLIGMGSWFAMGLAVEYLSKLRESGGLKKLIADIRGSGS